jgi:hypothetical protein
VVAPIGLQLAAARAGLRIDAASIAPSAAPAPTRLWISSMNRMMSPRWVISFITFLRRSSNSPRYFEPATRAARVQRVDLLALEQLGDVGVRDALREALDDGGLADAGLADEDRVVLRAAREDLHDPLDLGLPADDRVELAVRGELGQVAPELVEQLRGLLALALRRGARAGARARALAGGAAGAAPAGAGEHADDLVADLLGVRVEVEEDAGGDALVLAHEPEEDVLRPDVVVAEAQGLAQGELEDLLGPRRERDLPGGDLFAGADDAHDLRAHALHRDVQALEHAGREALFLPQQAEQDVLGPDVVVLERPRLFLREDHDLAGPFCESLEHGAA